MIEYVTLLLSGDKAKGSRFSHQADFGQEQAAPTAEAAAVAAAAEAAENEEAAQAEENERKVGQVSRSL
jgi:hypothetical protein